MRGFFYNCNKTFPVHFAVTCSKWGYSTEGYWSRYYGGVNAYTKEQFEKVNGFSNLFFGWGGEDDDFLQRTLLKYKQVVKLPPNIGRYYMVSHKKEIPNPERFNTMENSQKLRKSKLDGLDSVTYDLVKVEKNNLFVRFYVSYNKTVITQLNNMNGTLI